VAYRRNPDMHKRKLLRVLAVLLAASFVYSAYMESMTGEVVCFILAGLSLILSMLVGVLLNRNTA
jgi:hypothetical protein